MSQGENRFSDVVAREEADGIPGDDERTGLHRTRGRRLFLALGWASVGLGALGLLLPLLPTTPFLLLAAWAFGRSSPRWRRRLLDHPRLGPPLRAWEEHRVIPARAKGAAVAAIAVGFAWLTLAFDWPVWALAATGAIPGAVSVWIVSRPSRPPAP